MKVLAFFSLFILLFGCSSEQAKRDPDFQAETILPPTFLDSLDDTDEKEIYLAIVDEKRTEKERDVGYLPEEWEAYRIALNDKTRVIDHNGSEITIEELRFQHRTFNIWIEESFQSSWSKVEMEEGKGSMIRAELFPFYTATQIQLIPMTDEDYLAHSFADEEGTFSIEVYMNGIFDEENGKRIQDKLISSKVKDDQVRLKSTEASERKEKLLNIERYPVFLVYDHEGLVFKTYDVEELIEFLAR